MVATFCCDYFWASMQVLVGLIMAPVLLVVTHCATCPHTVRPYDPSFVP